MLGRRLTLIDTQGKLLGQPSDICSPLQKVVRFPQLLSLKLEGKTNVGTVEPISVYSFDSLEWR